MLDCVIWLPPQILNEKEAVMTQPELVDSRAFWIVGLVVQSLWRRDGRTGIRIVLNSSEGMSDGESPGPQQGNGHGLLRFDV